MARDDVTSLTRGVVYLIESVAGLFSKTLEVFLRYDFGQRYFGLVGLLVVYLLSWFINLMAWVIGVFGPLVGHFLPVSMANLGGIQESRLIPPFSHIFLVVGSLQVIITWLQARRGVSSHTRYSGKCLPFWYLLPGMTEERVKRFAEPAACILACVFYLDDLDPVFSSYIRWSAISLFLKSNLEYARKKGMGLDLVDMQFEAKELNELVSRIRRPPGATTPGAAAFARPSRGSGPSPYHEGTPGFEGLDPELQVLFGVPMGKVDDGGEVEIDGEVVINGAVVAEEDRADPDAKLDFRCSGCGTTGRFPAHFAAHRLRCKKCGKYAEVSESVVGQR